MHRLIPLFFLFAFLVPAHTHEVRPGYIEITEVARDSFDIVWKQPVRSAGANAVAGDVDDIIGATMQGESPVFVTSGIVSLSIAVPLTPAIKIDRLEPL